MTKTIKSIIEKKERSFKLFIYIVIIGITKRYETSGVSST